MSWMNFFVNTDTVNNDMVWKLGVELPNFDEFLKIIDRLYYWKEQYNNHSEKSHYSKEHIVNEINKYIKELGISSNYAVCN